MSNTIIDILKLKSNLPRPLILDGAMGSLLTMNESYYDKFLWASLVNLKYPNHVIDIHKKYIDAGAQIITTNTFRTNPFALELSNIDIGIEEFVGKSVGLAVSARDNRNIAIAGSNAPAEDCYQIERNISVVKLDYNHKKHIELLWESGSDFILNETQSHWDELEIITKFCSSNNIPFIISFFFTSDLRLLSGEPLQEAIAYVQDYLPLAISFNCIDHDPFKTIVDLLNVNCNWGFYLNCGAGTYTDKVITCGIDPDKYIEIIKESLLFKPLFVGSCCGSTPAHTKAIKEYFDEIY